MVVQFYKDLFTEEREFTRKHKLEVPNIIKKILEEQVNELQKRVTWEEIESALFSIKEGKTWY